MKVFAVVACALLSVAFAHTVPSSAAADPSILHECFEQDSISCVQQTVYRHAREFFDKPSIQLFSGVAFAKSNERAAKSVDPQVEQATSVHEREAALEDFLVNRAKNFFTERKLTWDIASTGRAISNAIPEDIKEKVTELVEEARTRKKIKLLKKLVPILGLVKLKLAGLAVLAVAAIGAIAKTALVTSFIAIAIAGASFLGSIFAKLFGIGSGIVGGIGSKASGLGSLGGGSGGGLGSLAASLGGGGGLGSGLGGGLGGGLGSGGGLGGLSGLLGGGNAGNQNTNVEEIIAYTTNGGGSGGNGWSNNGWSNQGWDEHGSHSQPIGSVIAYNGHNPKNRR